MTYRLLTSTKANARHGTSFSLTLALLNAPLLFEVAFICSILTHCGVCDLSVWRLKWEVSYVHQRVWRWKWFFCQSSYVLQRLRLCRASDTVFRREIDSQRQWGYGTCYGDSFPTAKECSTVQATLKVWRSVNLCLSMWKVTSLLCVDKRWHKHAGNTQLCVVELLLSADKPTPYFWALNMVLKTRLICQYIL